MRAEVDEGDVLVFALPRHLWTNEENATTNHFRAVTFGTEEEALDWCYEYCTEAMKWSPYQMDIHVDVEH